MLLVSTVEEWTPGEHIMATFWVDPSREIFKGHSGRSGVAGRLFRGMHGPDSRYSAAAHGAACRKSTAVSGNQQYALSAKSECRAVYDSHKKNPSNGCFKGVHDLVRETK